MTLVCLKAAASVLFFLRKAILVRPSHSLKFTGGGGFLGSILTTADSTLGGGLKLFLPTFMIKSHFARSSVLILNRQKSLSPGEAINLCANSNWNMRTAHLKFLCSKSLKTSGEEIWYGTLAMHKSKNGNSGFLRMSPTNIWSFDWKGVPRTRFWSSATILGSISQATTFFAFSKIFTVMLPVPGPISTKRNSV